jgi:hypothetical protein
MRLTARSMGPWFAKSYAQLTGRIKYVKKELQKHNREA